MALRKIRSSLALISRQLGGFRSRLVAAFLSSSEPDRSLSKDEIFDLLRNQRRRAVIRYLLENGGRAKVDDVTEAVAAEEFGKLPAELSSIEYKRVYTGLYQCHLERMEQLDVLDVDRTMQTVELRDPATQLARFLPDSPGRGRMHIEAGALGAAAAIIALGALGAGPFGAVAPASWVYLTVLLLLGLGLVHSLERRPAV